MISLLNNMNTKILQKCVDELNKEQPNIPYIKGILETLIEVTGQSVVPINPTKYDSITTTNKVREILADEEVVPEHLKAGPIGKFD